MMGVPLRDLSQGKAEGGRQYEHRQEYQVALPLPEGLFGAYFKEKYPVSYGHNMVLWRLTECFIIDYTGV